MRVLVDADSLKPRLRELIVRAGARNRIQVVFVANRQLPLPDAGSEPHVTMMVADDTDEWLNDHVDVGDLVVTRDIPLAARLIGKGAEVITDRGERYTEENIGQRQSERAFAMRLRSSGEITERGRRYGPREIAEFANLLDRELTRRSKAHGEDGTSVDKDE